MSTLASPRSSPSSFALEHELAARPTNDPTGWVRWLARSG
jgi:hypothetical protein